MKILSQILIVILAVALVAGATFLIVNQTGSVSTLSADQPAFDGAGRGPGNGTGPGIGEGLRGEGGEQGGSSLAWQGVLKNVGIIAAFTVLVSLVRLVFRRKPQLQQMNG